MLFVLHFFFGGGYTLPFIRLIGSLTGRKAVNGYTKCNNQSEEVPTCNGSRGF